MKILYIVRTFAPVGGMERYVFETAHEMARLGHEVSVLCRTTSNSASSESAVKTIVLQAKGAKRGWQDRVFFARVTHTYLREHPNERRAYQIIHSHENTTVQNVLTEHGPCTLAGLRRAPWKFFDYSALRNLLLERAKFASPCLLAAASCSSRVEETLLKAYPRLAAKDRAVIPPAYTHPMPIAHRIDGRLPTLGFIGFDWRRKGLPKAIEVFRVLKEQDSRWKIRVAGCDPAVLPAALIRRAGVDAEFIGRCKTDEFFAGIDVLLHPASEEPFGMVVTEALASGVPVAVSNRCGCVDHVSAEGLVVVGLDAALREWAQVCSSLAVQKASLFSRRTWSDVAADHVRLYEKVLSGRQPTG